jgi:catechol 2,3-dioxygenase-like lactoylglutathione lyase family enzyme
MRTEGIMLMTDQIEQCSDFYRTLLARDPVLGAGWAQFTLDDGSLLALHSPWAPGMTTTGGSQVLLLRVASLADESARLRLLGIECSEPHEIPGGAVVSLTDPDGRALQLIERTA